MSVMEGRHNYLAECVDTVIGRRTDSTFCPVASAASPMINRPCQKRAGLSLTCVVTFFSLTVFPGLAQDRGSRCTCARLSRLSGELRWQAF